MISTLFNKYTKSSTIKYHIQRSPIHRDIKTSVYTSAYLPLILNIPHEYCNCIVKYANTHINM